MGDNLASLFAAEPPDGTLLVAEFPDGLNLPRRLLIQRDDANAADLVGRNGRRWWRNDGSGPRTLTGALQGAARVWVAVPLQQSGLALVEGGGGSAMTFDDRDPAQVRMDDLAADRAERLAAVITEALAADGYNPVPAVGQDWEDMQVTWLPSGHRSIVRITSIGKTVNGWQCRVVRRQIDETGATMPSGDGAGVIFLDHLVRHYRLVEA